MTLNEAIKNNIPLVIDLGDGNRRYMATSFIVPGGIVFLDTGWASSEFAPHNPVHFVEGEVSGDGPWKVGNKKIEQMEDGDELALEHNTWNRYLLGEEGKQLGTRSRAWSIVRDSELAEKDLT